MQSLARPIIPVVVAQHAEESAMLRHVRSVLVRAPHVKLHQLRRLDDRIAAHLDGLSVAGPDGTAFCTAALARPGAGEVFACTVRAIEERDDKALHRLLALAGALADAKRGLLSAFGWVSAQQLQGIARDLLGAKEALPREVGIAACRLHRADPGAALIPLLGDADASLRAAAVRAAGELGRVDLADHVLGALADLQMEVRFQAARSACLLGNRDVALRVLDSVARGNGPDAETAITLLLQASDFSGHANSCGISPGTRSPRLPDAAG